MKLQSPTIAVLHKVDGVYAASTFKFDGFVDRKRVKREIIKAFRRGGEVVSPQYIEASITASLKGATRKQKAVVGATLLDAVLSTEKRMNDTPLVSIHDAEEAHADDTGYPRITGTSDGQHPAPLVGEALDKAVAGFEQQAKDNYEVSKEIQERDANAKKAKKQRG